MRRYRNLVAALLISVFPCIIFAAEYTARHFFSNGGGLNDTNSLDIAINESSDCQNVYFDAGTIVKRNGFTTFIAGQIYNNHAVTGLTSYTLAAGTNYIVAVAADTIYKNNGTAWADITGTSAISDTTDTNLWDMCVARNTLIGTGLKDQAPWKWTGTGNAAPLTITDFTTARYVEYFHNHLMVAVTTETSVQPARLRYSDLNTIETWSGGSSGYIDIENSDGQFITGMVVWNDYLLVFKERGIYRVTYTGNATTPFSYQPITKSIGCVSNWTIQNINGTVYWMAVDGHIYAYNGARIWKITGKVANFISGCNYARFQFATSILYKEKNWYCITYSNGSSSTHDRVLVIDYETGSITKFVGINALAMAVVPSSSKDVWIHGDYDGYAMLDDYGSTDNGSAIAAYWKSAWLSFDDPGLIKNFRKIYLVTDQESSTYYLNMGLQFDLSDTNTVTQTFNLGEGIGSLWGTIVWGSDTWGGTGKNIYQTEAEQRGKFLRLHFYNNNASQLFRIYGFTVTLQPIGYQD